MRYHSKTTLKGVKAIEETLKMSDGLYLVALSGGADSVALLKSAVIASRKNKNDFTIGAVIVDHGMQEGSDEVAEQVRRLSESMGIPTFVRRVRVNLRDEEGLEAAARRARYEALRGALSDAEAEGVLLGHTLNDQAEQVFLGLLRGSGTKSLAGIPTSRDSIIRPFLHSLTREETEMICEDNGLEYWEDPHNDSLDFTRVRVRKNLLPILEEEFGSGIIKNLDRTAVINRENSEALDFFIDETFNESFDGESLEIDALVKYPVGIHKGVIRKALVESFGSYGKFNDVKNVYRLISDWSGQRFIAVERGFVYREDGRLFFTDEPKR